MKIKHLLIGMLAIAGAVACKQDEPVEEPKLEVNKTNVAIAATAGEGAFEVTANNAWTAAADADWVSLDPASGNGGEKAATVKVTAEDNTATEARTATVTVKAGALTKTLKVTQAAAQGEQPGPGDEPGKDEVAWSMMGCFVDNLWSTDVPMAKEGEWIVAKGAQFTELTFKIRGNASWDDATNIGVAPGSDRGVVNGKVAVVTAEYAKANLGGDAADIRINGEAGTYDVYFSFENLEVYVMEQGCKPGEKEPQNPDPVEITYTVVGTLNNINWNNSAPEGLMTFDGQYHVAKNVPFVTAATLYDGADQLEFKIVETGSWTGYGRVEDVVNPINTEIAVKLSGDNIMVSGAEGNYDVYFDKENAKVWVLTPGATPGDAPEAPVTPVTEGDIWVNDGTVGAAAWSGSPYRFAKEGMDGLGECCAQIPAAVWEGMKIAPFCVNVKPATAETEWWQIRVLDGWWTINDESGASDINPQSEGLVNNGDGTFTFQVDLTTNPDLVALIDAQHLLFAGDGFIINKIYFGDLPTPGEPEQPELQKSEWALVGSFNGWDAKSDLYLSVLDENYFVYYGFDMPAGGEFKFLKGGVWPPDGQEVGGNGLAQPNTIQTAGGSNIKVNEAGKYDIYLAADLSKFYIMSEGKLPSEATEPAPVETTWGMMGCFVDNTWAKDVPMTKEGEWIVAKGAQFTELTFKIRANESWSDATNIGVAPGSAKGEINTKVSVVTAEYAKANLGGDAADIKLNGEAGTYDVYFSYEKLEVYVMTPGLKPGETPVVADYDIDGKQWMFTWAAMGATCVIDLGVTMPDVAILAFDMGALEPSYAGIYYPYMVGYYSVTKTDGTSGVVALTDIESGKTINIPYSNATENTVHMQTEVLLEGENIDCTLATTRIEISTEATESLPDGEYWIIANDKVATPLTSNYGYLQVTDAIDGKSYAANAFTFTQVEEGLYTIQDASGKYYYQTGTYNSFNVSETDGKTDEYLWEVYDTGNGTYAIINYEVGKYIQYDTQYNSYGSYSDERGLYPVLVPADDPIAEPEPEPTPEGAYTYTFKSGDLNSSSVTLGDVVWTFAMTDTNGSNYLGWDSNGVKGVQIGKKADPAKDVTLSTTGIQGKIASIKVNTSGASGTDAKLEVSVGGVTYGSKVSLTTTATDYTFEGSAEGEIVLHWTATAAAIYVKSIEIVFE